MSRIYALVIKDLKLYARSREFFYAAAVFALLVLILFSFAIDPAEVNPLDISSGILWIAFSFAGVLAMARTFSVELSSDCLDALLLSPLSAREVLLSKVIINGILMGIFEILCLPLAVILYRMELKIIYLWFLPIMLLGTIAFVVIGTLFSTVSASSQLKDSLLPILLFPITIPALIASVQAWQAVLHGYSTDAIAWLEALAGFDLVFSGLSFLLVDYILEG